MSEQVKRKCPNCGSSENSVILGGNDKCFHCGKCDYVQCVAECPEPAANPDSAGEENDVKDVYVEKTLDHIADKPEMVKPDSQVELPVFDAEFFKLKWNIPADRSYEFKERANFQLRLDCRERQLLAALTELAALKKQLEGK